MDPSKKYQGLPDMGSRLKNAGAASVFSTLEAEEKKESLEERKLRLEQFRENIKRKKEEQDARLAAGEEQKRDTGDVFRRTGMKFNENPDQKQARLQRCLKALKNVDIGKPSAFVGMEVGKPIHIDWSKTGQTIDDSAFDGDEVVEIAHKGKRFRDDDDSFL